MHSTCTLHSALISWGDQLRREKKPPPGRRQRIEEIKRNTQYLQCEFERPDYPNAVKAAHAKEIDIEVPLDPRFID